MGEISNCRTELAKTIAKNSSSSSSMRAAYPSEEELVRKIHRKVGGPSKLSTYDDPAVVREVVILALADEQSSPTEAGRVAKGDLSAFERRVVRTVTNRGAAVRSRMRQRKELQRLREELRRKDRRLQEMEAALFQLTGGNPPRFGNASPVAPPPSQSVYLPPIPQQHQHPEYAMTTVPGGYARDFTWTPSPIMTQIAEVPPSCTTSSSASLSTHATQGDTDAPQMDASLDHDMLGCWIDQLISPLS